MAKCKHETSNGRCGLKDCYAYRHKCYTEEFCKCHQPQTNADQIRAMSDEELYLWAKKQIGCGFDFFPCGVVCDGKCESYSDKDCKTKIMNWLRQPAEVSNDGT